MLDENNFTLNPDSITMFWNILWNLLISEKL